MPSKQRTFNQYLYFDSHVKNAKTAWRLMGRPVKIVDLLGCI